MTDSRSTEVRFCRSLRDFGELSPAEDKLLRCSMAGELAVVGNQLPKHETEKNWIRSTFVRFLALGGDDESRVHERGIQLKGAWLRGPLDLEAAEVKFRLELWSCHIERIDACQARLKILGLKGCRVAGGLNGDGLRCEGGVFLSAGFHASGEVRFPIAVIEGILTCQSGTIENKDGNALNCEGAVVSGWVELSEGFRAEGEVNFASAKIGGMLTCDGGRFRNADGIALRLDGGEVSGSVLLSGSFHATGEVRLLGAMIKGDLDCSGGRFENANGYALICNTTTVNGSVRLKDSFRASGAVSLKSSTIGRTLDCSTGQFDGSAGNALSCDFTEVKEALFFCNIAGVSGRISLASMRVANLRDDLESWNAARGSVILDGFTYSRLLGEPTRADARIMWLDGQEPDHLQDEFRPQPWEQLVSVLRAMGLPDDARQVAMAKQDRLRRAGKIVRGMWALHWLYGKLVGYGYLPRRMLVAILVVWLACAAAYSMATRPGSLGASTPLIAERGRDGPRANSDYATFEPLIYSADVLLPVVDLGYQDQWQPVLRDAAGRRVAQGEWLRYVYWAEIAFGWIAGLLLATMMGTLIKKD